MDWSSQLDNITQTPKTVPDTVNRLMTVLNDEQKLIIATMKEDDLIDLHNQNSFLLKSCGSFMHPDDASEVIITKLWERLKYGD